LAFGAHRQWELVRRARKALARSEAIRRTLLGFAAGGTAIATASCSDKQGRYRPDPGEGYDTVEPLRLLAKAIAVVDGVSHLHP